jgi:hypothetical protein
VQPYAFGQCGHKAVFVFAIGFAQLALCTIAIHGVAQFALGNTQQHFHFGALAMVNYAINDTHGIDYNRLRARCKKLFYVIAQA